MHQKELLAKKTTTMIVSVLLVWYWMYSWGEASDLGIVFTTHQQPAELQKTKESNSMTSINVFTTNENSKRSTWNVPEQFNTSPSSLQAVSATSGGAALVSIAASGSDASLKSGSAIIFDTPQSNYSISVDNSGRVTVGSNSWTGAEFLVFSGAQTVDGASNGSPYSQIVMLETGSSATLARIYQAGFGRMPDLPGLQAWKDVVAKGSVTMSGAANNFLHSGEWASSVTLGKAHGPIDSMTTGDFVLALYGNVLGRNPLDTGDTAGYNSWVNALNAGQVDRANALINMANSTEEITHSSSWLIDPLTQPPAASSVTPANFILQPVNSGSTVYLSAVAQDSSLTATGVTSPDWSATSGSRLNKVTSSTAEYSTNVSNITINASDYVNWIMVGGSNDTVNIGDAGMTSGLVMFFANSETVNINHPAGTNFRIKILSSSLDGTSNRFYGNTLNEAGNITVSGYQPGLDALVTPLISGSPYAVSVSSAASASPSFGKNVVINLGALGDSSAATAASALAAGYHPTGAKMEVATVIDQVGSDTYVWSWVGNPTMNVVAPQTITQSELTLGMKLIGVSVNSMTSADFIAN